VFSTITDLLNKSFGVASYNRKLAKKHKQIDNPVKMEPIIGNLNLKKLYIFIDSFLWGTLNDQPHLLIFTSLKLDSVLIDLLLQLKPLNGTD
jgi:hypothetical protein